MKRNFVNKNFFFKQIINLLYLLHIIQSSISYKYQNIYALITFY